MDKMTKKFKDAICDCFRELKGEFYHGEYGVVYVFDNDEKEVNDGRTEAARISTDPVYLNVTLYIYSPLLEMWKNEEYDSLLRILVHEFCHLLTEPLYRFSNDYISEVEARHILHVRERQTQRIANIAYNAIDPKKYIKILKGK